MNFNFIDMSNFKTFDFQNFTEYILCFVTCYHPKHLHCKFDTLLAGNGETSHQKIKWWIKTVTNKLIRKDEVM